MSHDFLTGEDERLLLELLDICTVTPMEAGRPTDLGGAQALFASHARAIGFDTVLHEAPTAACLRDPRCPRAVHEATQRVGEDFFRCQPNLVLRLGPSRAVGRTLMFNVHLDTVDGHVPTAREGDTFFGRGAVDAKGPGVALLAGIRRALGRRPDIADELTIIVQAVGGEEGGAMGVYGTKLLAERGYVGRLNVFAEPSSGVYFDHSTTSMTARIAVQGRGSTDDEPCRGDNATILLGYIAQFLTRRMSQAVFDLGGKVTIAGLHTGTMHNRVFGSGTLLVNFAYSSASMARTLETLMEERFAAALWAFRQEFAGLAAAKRTVDDVPSICALTWLKRALPVLANRDTVLEGMLDRLGLVRNPEAEVGRAFTCDAMWVQGAEMYTIVLGPGGLGTNGAHAEGEYVTGRELNAYASSVADVVEAFHGHLCARAPDRARIPAANPGGWDLTQCG